jgi:hypothetical protein
MNGAYRFATWPTGLEEVPEPFHGVLRERLTEHDLIGLLVFSPPLAREGASTPGTLLALTGHRWLVVFDAPDGGAAAVESGFENTLVVEYREIVVHGQLKLDFVVEGEAQSCAIEFNTASGKLYREAVRRVLQGIDGRVTALPSDRPAVVPAMDPGPIVFHNAVPEILAEGRRPVAAVQWPAVYGSYGHKLGPAAALLATDRELVLVSEKRERTGWPLQARHGYIATHFPLVRLAGFSFRRHERFIALELEMRAGHGGETVQIVFPPGREQEVMQVLECTRRQSDKFLSALSSC